MQVISQICRPTRATPKHKHKEGKTKRKTTKHESKFCKGPNRKTKYKLVKTCKQKSEAQ